MAKFAERSNLKSSWNGPLTATLLRLGALRRKPTIKFSLIPPARGRRTPVRVTPRYRRRGTCKTGRQGKHKSQFYNILGVMGQTAMLLRVGLIQSEFHSVPGG